MAAGTSWATYLLLIVIVGLLIVLLKPSADHAPRLGSTVAMNMDTDLHPVVHAKTQQLRSVPAAALPPVGAAAVASGGGRPNAVEPGDLPTWTEEFWSPTDVGGGEDPRVTLCKLDFKQYWEAPHLNSMFKDF